MLQSKQLLAATLAVDEPDPTLSSVTVLSEKGAAGRSAAKAGGDGGGGGGEGEGELEDLEQRTSTLGRRKKSSGKQKAAAAASVDNGQLKRGSSKRRSL